MSAPNAAPMFAYRSSPGAHKAQLVDALTSFALQHAHALFFTQGDGPSKTDLITRLQRRLGGPQPQQDLQYRDLHDIFAQDMIPYKMLLEDDPNTVRHEAMCAPNDGGVDPAVEAAAPPAPSSRGWTHSSFSHMLGEDFVLICALVRYGMGMHRAVSKAPPRLFHALDTSSEPQAEGAEEGSPEDDSEEAGCSAAHASGSATDTPADLDEDPDEQSALDDVRDEAEVSNDDDEIRLGSLSLAANIALALHRHAPQCVNVIRSGYLHRVHRPQQELCLRAVNALSMQCNALGDTHDEEAVMRTQRALVHMLHPPSRQC